nr:hypothetical protein [uncultured Desulfobulbus sp.]
MNDKSIKIEAEAKVLALKYGAISLEEIIEWSDGKIQSDEKPNIAFIELSLSKSLGEALSALNAFGQSGSREEVSKIAFRYFYNSLKGGHGNFQRISKALFDMVMKDYSPSSDANGPMWSFWDDLDLAIEGTYGNADLIKQEMLEFLNKYKG